MFHSEPNKWTITLPIQSSDYGQTFDFKSLVDDQFWQVGANERVLLTSQGATYSSYPFYLNQQGGYRIVTSIYSSAFNNSRDMIVYFPPSYYENTLKKYDDVLIMHDGENLFSMIDCSSFFYLSLDLYRLVINFYY